MSLYSLKNQKQFDLVNAYGKKITGPYFMIILAENFNQIKIPCENAPTLFGMKVSKKLSKKAYIRNKIKRRTRHLMRLLISEKELRLSKTAFIFIPFKKFEVIEFNILYSEFLKILKEKMSGE